MREASLMALNLLKGMKEEEFEEENFDEFSENNCSFISEEIEKTTKSKANDLEEKRMPIFRRPANDNFFKNAVKDNVIFLFKEINFLEIKI